MHAETSLFELFETLPRICNINLGHVQSLARKEANWKFAGFSTNTDDLLPI